MWAGQLNEGTFNLWMLRMKIILVEYIIVYNIPENRLKHQQYSFLVRGP